MARIKEYDRGSGRKRKRNPVVYIICEGAETEPRYFRAFRTRYCNIDIIPLSSPYKSADSLVRKAKNTLGEYPYYPDAIICLSAALFPNLFSIIVRIIFWSFRICVSPTPQAFASFTLLIFALAPEAFTIMASNTAFLRPVRLSATSFSA